MDISELKDRIFEAISRINDEAVLEKIYTLVRELTSVEIKRETL